MFILIMLTVTGKSADEEVLAELKPLSHDESKQAEFVREWSSAKFNEGSFAQKLTLTYTSEYVYRDINLALSNAEVMKVNRYLGSFYYESKSDAFSAVAWNGKVELYRGIDARFVRERDYQVGESFYWPSFTSLTEDCQTARKFAGEDGYIFVVHGCNSAETGHPTIDLNTNADWGYYGSGEQEVLLLPYAPFEVVQLDLTARPRVITLQALRSPYDKEFLVGRKEIAIKHAMADTAVTPREVCDKIKRIVEKNWCEFTTKTQQSIRSAWKAGLSPTACEGVGALCDELMQKCYVCGDDILREILALFREMGEEGIRAAPAVARQFGKVPVILAGALDSTPMLMHAMVTGTDASLQKLGDHMKHQRASILTEIMRVSRMDLDMTPNEKREVENLIELAKACGVPTRDGEVAEVEDSYMGRIAHAEQRRYAEQGR
eukprot:TRINITY_DN28212_c0_g1_i4.p1 TRINITY_DN28212_c0_g1~~TRINITY_DN28212_c0_g1_i4.p1  ORF type:complete len:434 (-),score=85.57 TRINITY_DN28212_c0_g1_i4:245-1546(-)